jgi:hypothetical protein
MLFVLSISYDINEITAVKIIVTFSGALQMDLM